MQSEESKSSTVLKINQSAFHLPNAPIEHCEKSGKGYLNSLGSQIILSSENVISSPRKSKLKTSHSSSSSDKRKSSSRKDKSLGDDILSSKSTKSHSPRSQKHKEPTAESLEYLNSIQSKTQFIEPKLEQKMLPFTPKPAQKELAEALYDYVTHEKNQLSFKKGDMINVSEKTGRWWVGELKGETGYVPSNCIQLISEKKTSPFILMPSPQIPKILQPQDLADQKDLESLLKWVTKGHLIEVEKLLEKNKVLALVRGKITDRSDRKFNNITAFQYAAWAWDVEMCEVILKYLDNKSSTEQLNLLETEHAKYSSHGAHYDHTLANTKMDEFIKNYAKWDAEKCKHHWQKEVGGTQRQYPAWLVYAMCEKGDKSVWARKVPKKLKFVRQYEQEHLKKWFDQEYNGGKLGYKWAYVRGCSNAVSKRTYYCAGVQTTAQHDREVSQSIMSIRHKVLLNLKTNLSSQSNNPMGREL